uniref:Predicted protein n=1 Tax=Physcomitrium patens TaxID=3218 RepID=A9TUX6_PHYPA
MGTCQIPETKMISSFHLVIEPRFHKKVKGLFGGDIETWSKFQELLKGEFIDRDEDRITKQKFLKWIEFQSSKHMDLYEFLEEFDRRFYQLSSSERRSLDILKVELFLNGLDDALGDKLFMLLVDESTGNNCNAKIKDLETNDNVIESYGYSILNKFVQVGDGNLDEKYLSDKKVFSTFERGEDVLPNTLDYIEEFNVEPLKKIDNGSIEGYNYKDCVTDTEYRLDIYQEIQEELARTRLIR